jgi:hypothetical protein
MGTQVETDVYEPSPVKTPVMVKQMKFGAQMVWTASHAWPASTTIGGRRRSHVPAVPLSTVLQYRSPAQPTAGTAARSQGWPASTWTMVLVGVQSLVAGWQKAPTPQPLLPVQESPIATIAPVQTPHPMLLLLQDPLWQLLARAQGAPAGAVPGVKHEERTMRSRSVHDSPFSSSRHPPTAARVRVDVSLKK